MSRTGEEKEMTIYRDRGGRQYVLVDKKQVRQTVTKWFGPITSVAEIAEYIFTRDMPGYMFNIKEFERTAGITVDDKKRLSSYQMLCPLEEVDEIENEFGPVSP